MPISHSIDSINFSDVTKVTILDGIVNLQRGPKITPIALNSLSHKEKISLQEGLKSYAITILNLWKQPDTLDSCITDKQIADLINWIVEKSDSSEFDQRLRAAIIIIECAYNPTNQLLHLDNFGLTSLPPIVGNIRHLKAVNITGNYLSAYPEEIFSGLPLLENKDEIKKQIKIQTTIYESPHLTSRDLFVKANQDLPSTLLSQKMLTAKIRPEQAHFTQSSFYLNLKTKIDQLTLNLQMPTTTAQKICLVAFVVLCPIINLLTFPLLFRYLKDQKEAYLDKLKAVSNISGIKALEGYWQEKLFHPASKALQDATIPLEIKSSIQSAINLANNSTATLEEYLQKIQEGQLVFLPIGYSTKAHLGHSAMIVIYQDKMIICNRGDRLTDESIYQYYQIDPSRWNQELIFNILNLKYVKRDSIQEGAQYQSLCYYKALPKALKAQKLPLSKQMTSKNQSVGNCSIASIKAAVQASCFLLQGGTEQAAIDSKKYKKSFTLTLRKQSVESVSGKLSRIFNYFLASEIITEAQNKIKKHEQKLEQLQTH